MFYFGPIQIRNKIFPKLCIQELRQKANEIAEMIAVKQNKRKINILNFQHSIHRDIHGKYFNDTTTQ